LRKLLRIDANQTDPAKESKDSTEGDSKRCHVSFVKLQQNFSYIELSTLAKKSLLGKKT